ncbi:hypothetical protein QOZ95_002312 [Paenibacillus brasilensis]|uniref:Uncharacterized protein n=1 Tax=Paenibacillus brasilensis TaxID=128574 RepID=A0ABU0KXI4_9BACL|nr:hypothetical protein [Paenibacillus brasilensis]
MNREQFLISETKNYQETGNPATVSQFVNLHPDSSHSVGDMGFVGLSIG